MCSSQRRVIPGLDKGSPERVCKVCFDLINIEEAQRLCKGSSTQDTVHAKPQELSDSARSESSSSTSSEPSKSSQRSCPVSEDFLETVVPVSSSEMTSWSGTSFSSSSSSSESEFPAEEPREKVEQEVKSALQVQEPKNEKKGKHGGHGKKKKKGHKWLFPFSLFFSYFHRLLLLVAQYTRTHLTFSSLSICTQWYPYHFIEWSIKQCQLMWSFLKNPICWDSRIQLFLLINPRILVHTHNNKLTKMTHDKHKSSTSYSRCNHIAEMMRTNRLFIIICIWTYGVNQNSRPSLSVLPGFSEPCL